MAVAALGAAMLATGAADAAPLVVSLDQCADQYVLALSPRAAIAGLSYRAEAGDSYLAAQARGLPKRRDSLESLLAARPQVVLRYWGGDARLVRALQARGVTVVTLGDSEDFDGVRRNIRLAAAALGDPAGAEGLIAAMDRKLRLAGARPSGRRVAYLTPGGATAGPGTLTDAMIRAGGLRNAETRPGYRELSLERMALDPPQALVLGFFDAFAQARTWWSPARSGVMRNLTRTRALASLPGRLLACPAWYTADGALALSRAAGT
jgi:iron complex transport system substrate-binding protein